MLKIIDKLQSNDKMAIKYIQSTSDNYLIETTYVNYYNKHIICFSSQIGCVVGCKICYSGIASKFYRNLTVEEMCEECINIIEDLNLKNKPILFSCMGVGEPLLNYDNVISTFKCLYEKFPDDKYALATTGIKPNLILKLASDLKEIKNFKLTLSLHATSDDVRKMIIPNSIAIDQLINAGKQYKKISEKKIEWNYVLLNNINDKKEDALRLIELLGKDEYVKLNQYNYVSTSKFSKSSDENIKNFIEELEGNINYEYYETNGVDVMGACGQMVCKKNDQK